MYHPIDYAVYQHVYYQSDAFMNHLKETNCESLVKNYSLRFDSAAQLIEEMLQTHTVLLQKQGKHTRCTIDDTFVGCSLYPSMAVCLAILDLHGEKAVYEEEAHQLVQQHIETVQQRKKALEERLNQARKS